MNRICSAAEFLFYFVSQMFVCDEGKKRCKSPSFVFFEITTHQEKLFVDLLKTSLNVFSYLCLNNQRKSFTILKNFKAVLGSKCDLWYQRSSHVHIYTNENNLYINLKGENM